MDSEHWLLLVTLVGLPGLGWFMCWAMDRFFGVTKHLRESERLKVMSSVEIER